MRRRPRFRGFAAALLCLLGLAVSSPAQITTAGSSLNPTAADSSGQGGVTTTSQQLGDALGEAAVSSVAFTSYGLFPGAISRMSFPGAVVNLTGASMSSTTLALSWSAPGYDGALGALQTGTSYRVQYSSVSPVTWAFASAQVSVSTSGISPGAASALSVSSLFPNTTYFLALWTLDAAGDLSGLSNPTTAATLATPPAATPPAFLLVGVSSATLEWAALPPSPASATAEGYLLQASTASDFSGAVFSSQTAVVGLSTLTVSGLFSNTTYYFRVGSLNWAGAANYTSLGSTLTLTSPDTTAPSAVANLAASAGGAASVLLTWTAPSDPDNIPLNGTYAIQYATWTGVSWSTASAQVLASTFGVVSGAAQGYSVAGLNPNTTYYFRLWTADAKPNWSPLSNGATAATLASPVANLQLLALSTGTAAFGWAALPPAPSSATAEGYRLEASTAADFSGTVFSSAAVPVSASTLTVSGLSANTTYYFRAASLNWIGAPDFASFGAKSTPALPVAPLAPAFLGAFSSSATARWAALPPSPSSTTSEGYVLRASSTNFGSLSPGGAVYSSATAAVAASTLTVAGLDPDTTYYFQAGSLDWGGSANYVALGATSTLAQAPVAPALAGVFVTSAAVSWTAPAGGAAGYEADASSTNFGALSPGGAVLSATVWNPAATALTVPGLSADTTYYFRAGSLNWNAVAVYAAGPSASTLAQPPVSPAAGPVFLTSATVTWSVTPSGAQGYRVQASSTNFNGAGTVFSSTTLAGGATGLTVSGLAINTTYYFRAGSLNWSGAPDDAVVAATATLAALPVSAASTFTMVAVTSATAQWSPNGNPAWTQYALQLSTAANFTGTLFSSATVDVSATPAGLAPNTTYFARVQALNSAGVATAFAGLGSTVTMAQDPLALSPAFAPVYASSLTVAFSVGAPANPAGTAYVVQLSTDPAFSVFSTSVTANLNAAFTGLLINATYYAQAAARNWLGAAGPFVALGSTATLTVAPGVPATVFTNLTASGFTVTWASGTAPTGYNPAGTTYDAQVSADPTFATGVVDVVVSTNSSGFGGLVSGTLYYARVSAVNQSGVASSFTSLGSVTTLNSSAPSFLAGTFQISNSQGFFISPSLYTDTTTPKLQVQVQSNFAPGLSVTNTGGHLALWHLDDAAGAVAGDSSKQGQPLALTGAPAPTWTAGKLGTALQFDGTQNFAVSPDLSIPGWRAGLLPADNAWSVNMWFNTTLGKGYLFQVSDANTVGGATQWDAELSWYRSTGRLAFEVTDNAAVRRYIQATKSYADGAWHFASAVLDPTGMYLYVDGALAVSGTQVNSNTAQTYVGPTYAWVGGASVVGANTGGSAAVRYYPGIIDEVLVTTVPLTAAQVSAEYALVASETHALGAPQVDVSSKAGANFSWTRLSTATFALTGLDGSVAAQTWTSTLSLTAPLLVQSTAPGAATNQVMFLASSLDANETTAQFTILVDTTPPAVPTYTALLNPTTFGLDVSGLAGSDDLSGLAAAPFTLQASTDPAFGVVNANSGWIAGPGFTFSTLLPNTTYFVRAQARDAAGSQGNTSAFSSVQSLATLALAPSATSFLNVYFTSATYAWAARPVSPASATSMGYQLDASTASDFSGTIYSSITAAVAQSTLTLAGLDLTTTNYFRVASINWAGVRNYAAVSPLNLQIVTSTTILSFGTIDPAIGLSSVSASSIVVTNIGNIPATVTLWAAVTAPQGSPWVLAVSSGVEQPVIQGLWNSVRPGPSTFTSIDAITASTTTSGGVGGVYAGDQTGTAVPAGATRVIWFRFWTPTTTVSTAKETIRVDMRPVFP